MPVFTKGCCCSLRTCSIVIGWLLLIESILSTLGSSSFFFAPTEYDKYKYPIFLYTLSGSGIISIIINILLLIGSYKIKKILLLPWLIINGICIIFLMIVITICTIYLLIHFMWISCILTFLIGGIATGIIVFIWLCVLSFYQDIEEEDRLNKRRWEQEVGFLPYEADPYSKQAYY